MPSPCVTVAGGACFSFSFVLASRWNPLAHLLLPPPPLLLLLLLLSHAPVIRRSTAAAAAAAVAEVLPALPPRRPPQQHGAGHRAHCTASFYILRVSRKPHQTCNRSLAVAHCLDLFNWEDAGGRGWGREPEKRRKKKEWMSDGRGMLTSTGLRRERGRRRE